MSLEFCLTSAINSSYLRYVACVTGPIQDQLYLEKYSSYLENMVYINNDIASKNTLAVTKMTSAQLYRSGDHYKNIIIFVYKQDRGYNFPPNVSKFD